MEYQYKSEYIHDLDTHKEFNRSYIDASPFQCILRLFSCFALLVLISLFDNSSAIQYFLTFVIVFAVIRLVTNPRNGDIQYKRMLQANNGSPSHQQQFFTETGVHCINTINGNHVDFGYDQFRYTIESKNLLILVMQHRTCLMINKASLEGGSVSDLFAFLKVHCPNLKGKKPRKTICGQIVRFLVAATMILGTIWALLNLPGYSVMDKLTGRLDNSMSYAQMADALSEVDIHISEQVIQEMVEYDNEYLTTYSEDYYANAPRRQKVEDLLYCEGIGSYNKETGQWTPSTSGIYCQEMEVWNADSIYSDFLTGVSHMDNDLVFTDIREDMRDVDIDAGRGTVAVTFTFQNETHTIKADYFYDWFDTYAIAQLGKIIKSNDQQLYVCSLDDYAAVLYYGTHRQVRTLEKLSGLNFKKAALLAW